MHKWITEFKTFALRGNVMDMAVGIIIGGAFGGIVSSLVKDVMMPPLSKLISGADFSNLFIVLGSGTFATLADAQKAGVATLNYGLFLNQLVNFTITAFAIFLLVKGMNVLRKKQEDVPAAPPPPSNEEKLLAEIRDLLKTP